MKSAFLNIFFALLIPFAGMAQDSDTTIFRRKEISLDVANIFRTGITPTLTYRYHFPNSAFRMRLSANFNADMGSGDIDDPGSSKSVISETSSQKSGYTVSFRSGYERIKKVDRFWIYAGADAFYSDSFSFGFTQTNSTEFDSLGVKTKDTESETETSIRVNQIGVAGFGGARFFFHPRVSVAVETGISLFYENRRDFADYSGSNEKTTDTRTRGLKLAWVQPLVNFSWHF